MKKFKISDLEISNENQIFEKLMPGKHIYRGGTSFLNTGDRTHNKDTSKHIHKDIELFMFIEGNCEVEINKKIVDTASSGDIIVVAPGEDHHIIALKPSIIMWCHGGEINHVDYKNSLPFQ